MIKGGKYLKRRSVRNSKPIPPDFIEEEFQESTGKRFGWVPVTEDDKWHVEAMEYRVPPRNGWLLNGTYELVGPKIQGNIENLDVHLLLNHRYSEVYNGVPASFDGIREFMRNKDIEGMVFHHPDGRMAKIKKIDYGLERIL